MNILCPICRKALSPEKTRYHCQNNHSFDIAKSGYLNLSLRKNHSGDNAKLIQAREDFLASRHYQFLSNEIQKIHHNLLAKTLLDLACGEGYYTSQFSCQRIGIDLSAYALRKAARKDPNGKYILSSIYQVPLADKSCDFILTCFAPIPQQEIERLLCEKGYFLLVRPAAYHLYEIKKELYPKVILNEEKDIPIAGLTLIKNIHIEKSVLLTQKTLHDLLYMTPYIYSTKKEYLKNFSTISELQVRFSFLLSLYQKN